MSSDPSKVKAINQPGCGGSLALDGFVCLNVWLHTLTGPTTVLLLQGVVDAILGL